MYRRIVLTALFCVCTAAVPGTGQCVGTNDSTLCMPELDGGQENEFSTVDGVLSSFWTGPGGVEQLDVVPPLHCSPDTCGVVSETDASAEATGKSGKLSGLGRALFKGVGSTLSDESDESGAVDEP